MAAPQENVAGLHAIFTEPRGAIDFSKLAGVGRCAQACSAKNGRNVRARAKRSE